VLPLATHSLCVSPKLQPAYRRKSALPHAVQRAVNIADLRRLAQARLPKAIFDYLDGGAEAEITLDENSRVFGDYIFRPRHGVHVPAPDLSVTIMGQKLAMPALLAPVGYSKIFHPEGEMGAARAAGRAGTGYAMSTISGYALEALAAATKAPLFLQLYLLGGRAVIERTIERAAASGCKGLFLTIDMPVSGMRERDLHNGLAQMMGSDLVAKLKYLPDFLSHPRWLAKYLASDKMKTLPNVIMADGKPLAMIDVMKGLQNSVATWDELKWICAAWKGPIAIKGVLTADDARRARDEGAAALVVSNHGGRQLDQVATGLAALPEVVAAVGGEVEVLMDGGIRRGGDIVKALALGARAVLLGRGHAYGLAAAGEAGIDRALEIFRADLLRTMKLLGCKSVADLDGSYIQKRGNRREEAA
jgi:isopentenyl diphosphate isomerase/L-lactate dehydrogenase-like FMN-dependent dehydrogenase